MSPVSRLSRRSCLQSALVLLPLAAAANTAGLPPIFVLNSLDATVSIVDPQTWTEVRRVPTGKEPHHLYLTPDEKSLLVATSSR